MVRTQFRSELLALRKQMADSETDKQLTALLTLARAIPGKLSPPPGGIRMTPERERYQRGRYRTILGRIVSRLVLAAYRAGEMDLAQALNVVHRCAAGSNEITQILGETATGALAAGEPKLLNRRKPAYPAWVKRFAVDLVDHTRKRFPQMPLSSKDKSPRSSVLQFVTFILAANYLCPMPPRPDRRVRGDHGTPALSVETVYRWYLDRNRKQGKSAARGRPRKKK